MNTKQIIAGMLRENTGASEKLPKNDFTFAVDSDGKLQIEGSKNVYHWLCERLEYASELDAEFQAFCKANDEMNDFEAAHAFAELKHVEGELSEPFTYNTYNTYNGEDCLSQVLQYTQFETTDGAFVLLQIHNGCDVRGGYTTPRVFEVGEDGFALRDNARVSIFCHKCHVSADSDNGGYSFDGDLDIEKAVEASAPPRKEFGLTLASAMRKYQGQVPVCQGKAFCATCGHELTVY